MTLYREGTFVDETPVHGGEVLQFKPLLDLHQPLKLVALSLIHLHSTSPATCLSEAFLPRLCATPALNKLSTIQRARPTAPLFFADPAFIIPVGFAGMRELRITIMPLQRVAADLNQNGTAALALQILAQCVHMRIFHLLTKLWTGVQPPISLSGAALQSWFASD